MDQQMNRIKDLQRGNADDSQEESVSNPEEDYSNKRPSPK